MAEQSGEPAKARITYYGHGNRETGAELPGRGLTTNVKMDLAITSGPGAGTETYYKGRLDARIAWLLIEGQEIPVFVDPEGRVTAIDEEALAPMLEQGAGDIDAAHDEQTSLRYSAGLPTRDEVGEAKEIAGKLGRAAKGLFRRSR